MQVQSSADFGDFTDQTIEKTEPSKILAAKFKSASSAESVRGFGVILTDSASLNIIRPSSRFATLVDGDL